MYIPDFLTVLCGWKSQPFRTTDILHPNQIDHRKILVYQDTNTACQKEKAYTILKYILTSAIIWSGL